VATFAGFAVIHCAGDVGRYRQLVRAELGLRGHGTVAPDLPRGDDSAGLAEYADTGVRRAVRGAVRGGRQRVRRCARPADRR
jgi:hypothetical protein